MKVRNLARWVKFVMAAAASACLVGCTGETTRSLPVHVYIGIDTSGGTRGRLGAFAAMAARLGGGRLQPGRDRVTLFTVCDSTQEFSDGPAPDSQAGLEQTIVRAVKTPPTRPGTRPAAFWSQVARRAEADGGARVAVVLLSDGDNDDTTPAARSEILAAGKRLASNNRVALVAVVAVNPENRDCLRKCFGPLGDRFVLQGPTEMDVDAVLHRLQDQSR